MNQKVQYNKLDTDTFIERSVRIWGVKYDYSTVNYIDSTHKVQIICPIHGEFEQLPSNHYKYGCGSCGRATNFRNKELNYRCKHEFIEKAHRIHENKYSYSRTEYVNAATKVTITCTLHGDFNVTPNNHLRGKGCPTCGRIISKNARLNPFDEYLRQFKLLYGDKYDYSNVKWKGSSIPISVVCKYHGIYNIIPYIHAKGKECQKCTNQYSKISIEWLLYMEISYNTEIQYALKGGEFRIPNTRYKADGYSKDMNMIFEFQGDFWHGNPKLYDVCKIHPRCGISYGELYSETNKKINEIREQGYNVITCWESDWIKFKRSICVLQKIWKSKNNENKKNNPPSSAKNNQKIT